MSRRVIEGSYARLSGLRDCLLFETNSFVAKDFADDYSGILTNLRSECDDEFDGFDLPPHAFRDHPDPEFQANKSPIRSKISQLISYLETVHSASKRIVEIGSAYNLIRDEELKSRCSDLLSAHDHFDRVINQATQVLEERIRAIVPEHSSEIGTGLINKAVKADPSNTPIKFSANSGEQEGYASILRGLVGAFRNPSHHRFLNEITREQALQICAFIDNMLSAIGKSEVN